MKKTTIMTGLVAVMLSGGIAAAQPGGMFRADADGDGNLTRAELTQQVNERFATLDADGDGSVTEAERQAARESRQAERFARLDANGDGAISPAEMQAGHEKRAGAGGRHDRGGKDRAGLDADGDGTVSRADFEARALTMFERLDADGDGTVTRAERQQGRANWHRQ